MTLISCPSTLALEHHLAGEPVEFTEEDVSAHVVGCARCTEVLAQMRAVGAAYVQSPAAIDLQGELRRAEGRTTTRRPTRRTRLWWLGVPAMAGLGLFVLRVVEVPDMQAKGAPSLAVMRQRGEGWEALADPASLVAGDVVQARWSSGVPGYLLVVLTSGETIDTLVADGDQAQRVGPMNEWVGPGLTFDGRQGGTLWGFFSDAPFGVEPIRASLVRRAPAEAFEGRIFRIDLGAP